MFSRKVPNRLIWLVIAGIILLGGVFLVAYSRNVVTFTSQPKFVLDDDGNDSVTVGGITISLDKWSGSTLVDPYKDSKLFAISLSIEAGRSCLGSREDSTCIFESDRVTLTDSKGSEYEQFDFYDSGETRYERKMIADDSFRRILFFEIDDDDENFFLHLYSSRKNRSGITLDPSRYEILSLESTDGWETYSNSRYGYSLKYPDHSRVTVNTAKSYEDATENTESFVTIRNLLPLVSIYEITIFPPTEIEAINYTDLDQYVRDSFNVRDGFIEPTNEPYQLLSGIRHKVLIYEKITVDGKPAIRLYAEPLSGEGATVDLSVDVVLIETAPAEVMQLSMLSSYMIGDIPILNLILSSIEFSE